MTYKYSEAQRGKDWRTTVTYGIKAVKAFRANNLPIPDAVVAAVELHEQLDATQRAVPGERAVRVETVNAYLEGATDAAIAKLISRELTADVKREALLEAVDVSRERVTVTVMAHADEMLGTVRERIFDPALDTIMVVAASNHPTASDALRVGDDETARRIADAPIAAGHVLLAYQIRRQLYPRSNIGELRTSVWRHGSPMTNASIGFGDDGTPLARYLDGIRAGGQLWLGTYAQVEDAERELEENEKAKRRAKGEAALVHHTAGIGT